MQFKLFYTDVVPIPFPSVVFNLSRPLYPKVSVLMAVAVVLWLSTPGLPYWDDYDDDVYCSPPHLVSILLLASTLLHLCFIFICL